MSDSSLPPGDTDADTDSTTETGNDSDTAPSCVNGETKGMTLDGVQFNFAKVCAHTFEMGCTTSQQPDCASGGHETEHQVTLTHDYYVAETEVTQAQYQGVQEANAQLPADSSHFPGQLMPVETISWHQSALFANALSDATGAPECYSCTGSGASLTCTVAGDPYSCPGFRLLTEAEWEAAARCGTDTTYAGSDTVGDVAWYSANSSSTTQGVGGKIANGCALYDMSGNVQEWTNDNWDSSSDYSASAAIDPQGASSGSYRVTRGGSWYTPATHERVADRVSAVPTTAANYIGVRLRAASLDP